MKSLSRVRLCDPGDCSPPGSSVHGILQARILEWVAISFSRGSSRPRDQTQVSHIAGRCFTGGGVAWETQTNFLLFKWGKPRLGEVTGLTQGHPAGIPTPLLLQPSLCSIKRIQRSLVVLGGIVDEFSELGGDQIGGRQHDTPCLPHPSAPPHPWQCPLGGLQAPGLHWQLGSRSFVSPGRFLRFALGFSFQP